MWTCQYVYLPVLSFQSISILNTDPREPNATSLQSHSVNHSALDLWTGLILGTNFSWFYGYTRKVLVDESQPADKHLSSIDGSLASSLKVLLVSCAYIEVPQILSQKNGSANFGELRFHMHEGR